MLSIFIKHPRSKPKSVVKKKIVSRTSHKYSGVFKSCLLVLTTARSQTFDRAFKVLLYQLKDKAPYNKVYQKSWRFTIKAYVLRTSFMLIFFVLLQNMLLFSCWIYGEIFFISTGRKQSLVFIYNIFIFLISIPQISN